VTRLEQRAHWLRPSPPLPVDGYRLEPMLDHIAGVRSAGAGPGKARRQASSRPPVTPMISPLMKRASADARKT
jgi:hypothetical protein